jgi:hypothetical protein
MSIATLPKSNAPQGLPVTSAHELKALLCRGWVLASDIAQWRLISPTKKVILEVEPAMIKEIIP